MLYRWLFCLGFTLSALISSGQELPMDSSVIKGQLDNGLSYYIQVNKKPLARAELRLVVKAGSLQEDEDQLGIAHFVEHMAFNGTQRFPKNELINYLELSGTRFGADLNAYTSFAETVYQLQSRTDSLALLETGLEVLREWASRVTFDSLELEKERGVVLSEWRTRLSPDQRLQKQYYPVLFQGSRFAERFPIGDPNIIETVPLATVQRFYKDWYRPDLMAIVAVGDFDPDQMETWIKNKFSDLKNPSNPRIIPAEKMEMHSGNRSIVATDSEVPFTRIQVSIKSPAQDLETKADFKNSLKALVYNKLMGARLYEYQQNDLPPFTFASSSFGSGIGDINNYTLSAFVASDQVLSGFGAVYSCTQRALQHGFTQTELDRQKSNLMEAALNLFQSQNDIPSARIAGNLSYHFLEQNPLLSPKQNYELYQDLLPQISLEGINTLASEWLKKDGRTLVVTAPERDQALLPSAQQIWALMDSIDQSEQVPYVDQVSTQDLFTEPLEPSTILSEEYHEQLGIWIWKLENNIQVILKPSDFKAEEILMQSFSTGGHSLSSDAQFESAKAAAMLTNLSGLGAFSNLDLQKHLSGKRVSVNPYISEYFEGINGTCSPENIELLFQLTYLYATQPRFTEKALLGYQQRQKNVLKNMSVNPYYFFANVLSDIKYNGHLRRKAIPSLEDLASLDIRDAESFYRDRFKDWHDATFLFVGNFEVDSIRSLSRKYLGNLPVIPRTESYKNTGASLVKVKVDTTLFRGKAPKSIIDLTYHGDFDYTAQNRYEFNTMLGVLRIKLREQLREELGGVYGVNVSGFNSKRPEPYYRVTIRFNAQPEMVDTLIHSAKMVIANLQNNGPDPTDLEKVKSTQIQSRIKAERQNSYWMAQLKYRFQNAMPLEEAGTEFFKLRVAEINEQAIQQAAKLYFQDQQSIQIVLMPEKN